MNFREPAEFGDGATMLRMNPHLPPEKLTGSELSARLAYIRDIERRTGRNFPTTIEANIRIWELTTR